MSHFEPPDSKRRRVGRPLSGGGVLAQLFRGRAVETPSASRNARKCWKRAIFGPHSGDPLTMSHFWATRQQATTRWKASFWSGPVKAQLSGEGQPSLLAEAKPAETLLPASRNAQNTPEH